MDDAQDLIELANLVVGFASLGLGLWLYLKLRRAGSAGFKLIFLLIPVFFLIHTAVGVFLSHDSLILTFLYDLTEAPTALVTMLILYFLYKMEQQRIKEEAHKHYLQELNRTKDHLVAIVSHELRTPMTVINGFSELLLTRQVSAETQQLWLETIHQEAQQLTRIINDLLDISRLEAGKVELHKEPLDLRPLINRCVEVFRSQTDKHTLKATLAGDLPLVLADKDRLFQILTNLVGNAIKYSPAGGEVTVMARPLTDFPPGMSLGNSGAFVEISVCDQGIGIPAEDLPRLFESFSRVGLSDTRVIEGVGLGLFITKNLVEMQGGRIEVESRPGQGSCFRFTLPCHTQ
ncbi:MAG: HAMP domain-containing histidine kinase [Chloroflexi bacterium]|nr:HAMP domain-containing histidine kinase [Chloroflexota bacterium]MCL5074735.1 HAMP domain-containing histidine kinase [Chloroflexota bacterium]